MARDTKMRFLRQVASNFTKKHGSLHRSTPADTAQIRIEGTNKWKTIIIQNASLSRD